MTSKKEKCFIFWLVFFFLASIGLLAGLIYLIAEQKKSERTAAAQVASINEETCLTKQCTLTASMLIEAMDTTVDPCEDFYTFACGNYIRNNPVPDNKLSTSAAWTFNKNFQLQLKNLVEGMGSLQGPKVMYRMQEVYHVCLNTTYQREKEFAAFKNYSQKVLNWPLATPGLWPKRFNSFSDYMAEYEGRGLFNAFATIQVALTEDDDNIPTPYKILIGVPWKHSFLLQLLLDSGDDVEQKVKEMDKKQLELGLKFFRDLVHLMGNRDDSVIDRDLDQIKTLVNYYVESSESKEDDDDDDDDSTAAPSNATASPESWEPEKTTFRELHSLTGRKINWLNVVNKKLRGKYEFKEDDVVFVESFKMFDTLKLILERYNLRTLVNILGWEVIFPNLLEAAGPDVEEMFNKFEAERKAIEKEYDDEDDDDDDDEEDAGPTPRWKICMSAMHDGFMLVVTRMFLEAYVDRNDKQAALELIQFIQEAYKDAIRKSPWLDDETRKNAIKKADAIKRYVAYPDFIFNDKALDEKYKDMLPIVHSTHFENTMEVILKRSYDNLPDAAEDSNDKDDWDFSPLILNAFYSPRENSIMFPSAILQLPFFQHNRLAAMNFGMIGAIIGHEIGHAFDDDGSRYDDKGEYNNWWSNSTREEFDKRGQCFVEQFNAYCPDYLRGTENGTDVCVNGERTLGENLADYTGITASFVAYKLWVEKHGAEKRLPGLREYSPEQLFFISNAYIWCENIPAFNWLSRYQYDSHAPGKYRVLGTVSNNAFFRDAFKCPVGAMNRGDKSCKVW